MILASHSLSSELYVNSFFHRAEKLVELTEGVYETEAEHREQATEQDHRGPGLVGESPQDNIVGLHGASRRSCSTGKVRLQQEVRAMLDR